MSYTKNSLKDKNIVITGGATGIGYSIADSFLTAGAKKIAILDINPKAGGDAVNTLNAKHGERSVFLKCDVTSEDDMNQVFKKLTTQLKIIGVLVNNAGIVNESSWKKCIDVNLTYLIGWSLKFWEYMRKDKSGSGGTIINIASLYGFRVDRFLPVYQASKFGVYGFSKSLDHQYNHARTGVRVVALCPGFTRTPLTDGAQTLEDDQLNADFMAYMEHEAVWQTTDCVGTAAVDLFEKSESGQAWFIEGGKRLLKSEVPTHAFI